MGRFISQDTHWHPGNRIYGDEPQVLNDLNLIPDPFAIGQSNNMYLYTMNSPLIYFDPDGQLMHIAIGALVGGVVKTAVSVGTTFVTGGDISWKQVGVSFASGALQGGVTAGTGNSALGAMAGGATDSLLNDLGTGKSVGERIGNMTVNAAIDGALVWGLGKVVEPLSKTDLAKDLTRQMKSLPGAQKIAQYNISYKSSITRARNAWNNERTIIKLTWKTLRNGIYGELGRKTLYIPSNSKDVVRDIVNNQPWYKEFKQALKDNLFHLTEGEKMGTCS